MFDHPVTGGTDLKFLRVEEFFDSAEQWHGIDQLRSVDWVEGKQQLILQADGPDGFNLVILIEILSDNILRFRFDPKFGSVGEYPNANSASIVMETIQELRGTLEPADFDFTDDADSATLLISRNSNAVTKISVQKDPYLLEILSRPDQTGQWNVIHRDDVPGIRFCRTARYTLDGDDRTEYAAIVNRQKPASSKYIGFGEKPGQSLCKNGKRLTYFNFDNMRYAVIYGGGAFDDREPLYHSNPYFLEFNPATGNTVTTGTYVDNVSECLIDVGNYRTDRLRFGNVYGGLDFYLFSGKSCPETVNTFGMLVGHCKLRPRWSLGYHQGAYGYTDKQQLMAVVESYRHNRIPFDGLHIDVDAQFGYRTFTFETGRFGQPNELFDWLADRGVKASMNITPIVANLPGFPTYDEAIANDFFVSDRRISRPSNAPFLGEVYYGGTGIHRRGTTGHYPSLYHRKVREWWGRQYRFLFGAGLRMVWQDMTTPAIPDSRDEYRSFPFDVIVFDNSRDRLDPGPGAGPSLQDRPAVLVRNLYSYNLHRATYHGLNEDGIRFADKRNFIVGRGGFTGLHRYAAIWTGDNVSTWEFMKINIPQMLALGLSGESMAGADIGGFEPARHRDGWADPELVIRWTILGAFLPWFRNHYTRYAEQNSVGVSKRFQEPYAFAALDLDGENVPHKDRWLYQIIVPICRHYIGLRYRLMQLFYDLLFENTYNAMPIVRPLLFNDGQDNSLFFDNLEFNDTQFFVGQDLMVAPVLDKQPGPEPNWGERSVYLPAGSNWYQFMDNRRALLTPVSGGRHLTYNAHLSADPDQIGFVCPLFVRAGGIIPTLEQEQYVGERSNEPITINCYPGGRKEYRVYEDDGDSRASAIRRTHLPPGVPQNASDELLDKIGRDPSANDEYRCTRFVHEHVDGQRKLAIDVEHDGFSPACDFHFVAFLYDQNEGLPSTVRINQTSIPRIDAGSDEASANQLRTSGVSAFYINKSLRIVFAKILRPDIADSCVVVAS